MQSLNLRTLPFPDVCCDTPTDSNVFLKDGQCCIGGVDVVTLVCTVLYPNNSYCLIIWLYISIVPKKKVCYQSYVCFCSNWSNWLDSFVSWFCSFSSLFFWCISKHCIRQPHCYVCRIHIQRLLLPFTVFVIEIQTTSMFSMKEHKPMMSTINL